MPSVRATPEAWPVLEARTLFAMLALAQAGLATAMAVVWKANRTMASLDRFPLAHGMAATSLGLVALLDPLPERVVAVAGVLTVLSAAMTLEGMRVFHGLRAQRAAALLAGLASLGAALAAGLGAVVFDALCAGLLGRAVWAAHHDSPKHDRPAGLRASASLAAVSVAFGLHAAAGALGLRGAAHLGAGSNLLVPLVALLGALGWSLGLILTVNERLLAAAEHTKRGILESEERYRSLVETSPDLIYRFDPRGFFTYANPAAMRLMGCRLEDIEGKRFLELIRPDFHERAVEFYERQGRERIPTTYFEFPAAAKDGRELWLGHNVQSLAEHETFGFEAIARDITERKQAESELRGQKQLFESLVLVARATAEAGDLDATPQNGLGAASDLTGAMGASIILLDERGEVLRTLFTGPGQILAGRDHAGHFVNDGLFGWVAQTGESALLPDTRLDARWLQLVDTDSEWRSALSVPISSGQSAVGVITLVHAEPGHFSADHRRLIEAAAAQLALSLRNAQVSEARLQLAGEQKLLYEVLEAASRPRDSTEIALAATQAIARHTGWPHVVVALPGEDGYWKLPGVWTPPAGFRVPLAAGVLGRVIETGRMQLLPDVSANPDFVASSSTTRSELAVPLRFGESILGVLNLESNELDAFGPDVVRLAQALAEPIALCLANARLDEAVTTQTARLEAVVRSSRDGLVLVDERGGLLLVSEPALRLLGLAGRPEDWLGRALESLWEALARGSVDASLRAAAAALGGTAYEGECQLAAGWLMWTSLPVPSVGRLVVFRDVTRERELEHMRDDLTHTMVHDLRSPLTTILGSLEWVGRSPALTPELKRMLEIATANAQRQLRLINSILDVNRLEQRSLPMERSSFPLRGLVDEVLRLLAPQAAAKRVELLNTVGDELPAAWADRNLTGRVVENLVGNAIKFTPAGGQARVGAERLNAANLQLSVSDNGTGVPAELRPRLFQKFAAGEQQGRGTGLGLAFCRLVVEAHGGRLWLASEPDSGAVFSLTLPAAEGAAGPASPPR